MNERVDAVDVLDTPAALRSGAARARQAYFAVALSIAAIVAWGFWKTYYSRPFTRTDLPVIVHIHATVFSLWVLVLVVQAAAVVGAAMLRPFV